MLRSYIRFWSKAFNYTDRASRRDFWVPTIIHFILYVLLVILLETSMTNYGVETIIVFIVKWVLYIPHLALMVRRYHDVNRAMTFPLILFIFFLFIDINGFIDELFYRNDPAIDFTDILAYILTIIYYLLLLYSLVICLLKGSREENSYGQPPHKKIEPADEEES
ncbi:DUF805 domain-containing protein [Staphylococcus sp. SQ8-PEA]|uniref:DUF805 domain-containing protein n=1 Tax=Staphylococcus marylandisciuri TaxID=2981529 RepID=A0ABT2QSN9_9STAP|nr:DUF805 domain-containing protein [Staphylococcus marylandisciuri]MCU5746980.1 DUF805 domain-containing protein [Staphylococcus marylandisciuri]